jgi:hypothetical protein
MNMFLLQKIQNINWDGEMKINNENVWIYKIFMSLLKTEKKLSKDYKTGYTKSIIWNIYNTVIHDFIFS